MEFQYERITERDKEYGRNDFDKTAYSSLYVRLQDIENKIEDGYVFLNETELKELLDVTVAKAVKEFAKKES